jgi:branched-chain amino acid aminotransferase
MARRALTFLDGTWHEGNPPIMGPLSHAAWMSSIIFDGARGFEGVAPDLDRHCVRAIASARFMGLAPTRTAEEIESLAREGLAKFPTDAAVYIRPMFWAEDGWIEPDPASTRFCLSIYESALPLPGDDAACFAQGLRRPSPEMAPTLAKAACLYPQSGFAMRQAKQRGFTNSVMLDPIGNVAEFATANIFMAKDGAVHTPVANGTFLAGITRSRVIELLRHDGVEVVERAIRPDDLRAADEIFQTGNFAKVLPCIRLEDRHLQPGPFYTRARKLYWDWAHS